MSDGEVKRYFPHTYHGGDVVQPSMEENEHGAWVKNEDHERVVAELKAQLEHSETKVTWLLRDHERIVAEKDAEIDRLRTALEAVRSQMCWERDRDQLTMGMASLHDDVTKALEKK